MKIFPRHRKVLDALCCQPVRVQNVLAGVTGLSPRWLASALTELRSAGLIKLTLHPSAGVGTGWALTAHGKKCIRRFLPVQDE